MKKFLVAFAGFAFIAAAGAGRLLAVDTSDTKLLTQPAVSVERLAFVYAMDLWTADLDGKNVRRLTSNPGLESDPALLPGRKPHRLQRPATTATPTSSSSPRPAASRSA